MIRSVFSLLRLHVYMPICFLCTMLGMDLAGNRRFFSFVITAMSLTFALGAAFCFNDAEDSADDKLSESCRNPVAKEYLSISVAYKLSVFAAILSIALSLFLGLESFLAILYILLVTFFYSWRRVRIKTIPFGDILVHVTVFGMVFYCTVWASNIDLTFEHTTLLYALCFALSGVIALLLHQLYEYENDRLGKIMTTTIFVGKNVAKAIMVLSLIVVIGSSAFLICKGMLPLVPMLVLLMSSSIVIAFSAILFPQKVSSVTKQVFPWAINGGAVLAILVWYFA